MRILHVGWGFTPWRPGGLIQYAEDVMAAQAARGHHVAYFLSGRRYPRMRRPRMKRWQRGGVTMYELVNPPVVAGMEAGTRDPLRELDEPVTERAFSRVLADERPDVVHVQELMGLPSSLLDIARDAGVRVVMTLQDYFPLCCTMRLTGECCMSESPGRGCVAANAGAPVDAGPIVARTVGFDLTRAKEALPLVRRVGFAGVRRPPPPVSTPVMTPAADYDRRRAVNVERLNRVERLIAMSERVAEIYRQLGVARVETMEFTLAHIERMHPRRARASKPLTFATLNGCASPSKGSEVILGALRARPFRLLVYGFVDPAAEEQLRVLDGVEIRGLYDRNDLDDLLEEVDVGILPSTWEEAYAYTGAEFRAKGIPVIANDIGGMREHGTWLNRSCTGEELAEIIGSIGPEDAQPRPAHVRSFAEHLDELYR